jgi:hypothetical protein
MIRITAYYYQDSNMSPSSADLDKVAIQLHTALDSIN